MPNAIPTNDPGRYLIPAGEPGIIGFVIEDPEGNFWDGEEWTEMLNDGAQVYTPAERLSVDLPEQGTWQPLYQHAVDGALTTEACSGVNTCQDCLDARRSGGETI